ncbi:MAG: hypothetical protein EXR99_08545 [Gemmataceae bacterium]|nr:hypothetical protein [Gemmataceae bacterium]
MAVLVTCQSCGKKLKVNDEILGKRVKCPGCAGIFTAVADGAASAPSIPPMPSPKATRAMASLSAMAGKSNAEEEDKGEEREETGEERSVNKKVAAKETRLGWQATRTGFNLLLIASYLYLSGIILQICSMLLVRLLGFLLKPGEPPSPTIIYTIITLLIICVILGLAAFIVHSVGLGFCLYVPKKEGYSTKTLALLTFIFWCIGIGFYILGFPLTLVCIGFILIIIAPFLLLAAHVLYLFFLRSVGLLMKRKDLAGSATGFMFANLGYVLSMFIFGGVFFFLVESAPRGGGRQAVIAWVQTLGIGVLIGVVALGIFALGLLIWYMILVRNIRDGITPKFTKAE